MIPKYKDIIDLLGKGLTLEAQAKIMELREAVLELQEENAELKRRVSTLEQELAFSKSLRFKQPFYYADGDDAPFCPKCWESSKKAVHLQPPLHVKAIHVNNLHTHRR